MKQSNKKLYFVFKNKNKNNVLGTVMIEFLNKRSGDGTNVTEFREDPGCQPQVYTKVT